MNQAVINTDFGELIIEFTNEKDLQTKIAAINIQKINETIISKFGKTSKAVKIIEEFKDLYTVDFTGIRLLKIPDEKTDQVRLALFLAGRSLSPSEIKYATGINKPTSLTGSKGFVKSGDKVTIDSDTRKVVLEKIIPELRGKTK